MKNKKADKIKAKMAKLQAKLNIVEGRKAVAVQKLTDKFEVDKRKVIIKFDIIEEPITAQLDLLADELSDVNRTAMMDIMTKLATVSSAAKKAPTQS
jgi:hypothetical protein